jgi:hypothetical protein
MCDRTKGEKANKVNLQQNPVNAPGEWGHIHEANTPPESLDRTSRMTPRRLLRLFPTPCHLKPVCVFPSAFFRTGGRALVTIRAANHHRLLGDFKGIVPFLTANGTCDRWACYRTVPLDGDKFPPCTISCEGAEPVRRGVYLYHDPWAAISRV